MLIDVSVSEYIEFRFNFILNIIKNMIFSRDELDDKVKRIHLQVVENKDILISNGSYDCFINEQGVFEYIIKYEINMVNDQKYIDLIIAHEICHFMLAKNRVEFLKGFDFKDMLRQKTNLVRVDVKGVEIGSALEELVCMYLAFYVVKFISYDEEQRRDFAYEHFRRMYTKCYEIARCIINAFSKKRRREKYFKLDDTYVNGDGIILPNNTLLYVATTGDINLLYDEWNSIMKDDISFLDFLTIIDAHYQEYSTDDVAFIKNKLKIFQEGK